MSTMAKHEPYTKYENHYINIDSRDRQKNDHIDYNSTYKLENATLSLKNGLLHIAHLNHNMKIDNKIKIDIQPTLKVVRSIIGNKPIFEIKKGSSFMKIFLPHNLIFGQDKTNSISICEFEGFDNMVGNINIELINKKHNIIIDDNAEYFFVDLGKELEEDYNIKEHTFKIYFNYILGQPISYFNNIHTIKKVDEVGYMIKVFEKNWMKIKSHNSTIFVNKVNNIKKAQLSNNYVINLQRVYNNVVGIRMTSFILPQGILNNSEYILMKINDYDFLSYKNENYFAKINPFDKKITKQLKLLANPIPTIKELHISFYNYKGELYDFNNLDHSFVLEIITLDETISNVGYYVQTHSNENMRKFNYLDPFF